MSLRRRDEARVLELTIHGVLIGYLAGLNNGRNILSIADSYKSNPERPTFSLITHPLFPNARKLMAEPWARNQRLHPLLSNLLPEGALRELTAHRLKVHVDNEFHIFAHLAGDLPGALLATPLEPDAVPEDLLASGLGTFHPARAVNFDRLTLGNKFSLAGVQMKFSMNATDGRYNLPAGGDLGDWIIKTPSTTHKLVPLNEFTAMSLAQMAGVDIPEIRLVDVNNLDDLPPINLPDERHAFAIKRFDRAGDRDRERRIHMEDFAQIFVKYPHDKYTAANYERIGRVLYEFSGDALADVQQLARRLLVNILLANGDAHLKNWSLWYPDGFTPRLSPAYDIVTTRVYFDNETQYALNLGKTKEWYAVTMEHFKYWSEKAGLPWRAIKPHLADTMTKARLLWPEALKTLPMAEVHKKSLVSHWSKLQDDFKIKAR